MKWISLHALFVGLLGSVLPWHSAHAEDFVWAVQGGVRFQYNKHPFLPETGWPQANQDLTGGSLLLGFLGALQLSERISLAMQLDLGELALGHYTKAQKGQFAAWLNDFQLQPSQLGQVLLEEGAFVRELYLTFHFENRKWHKLDVGIRNVSFNRHVYNGYALGIFYEADLRRRRYGRRWPLKFFVSLFLPDVSWTAQDKKSPVAHASVLWGRKDQAFLQGGVTYLYDGGNTAGRLYWPVWKTRSQDFQSRNISPMCRLRSGRCSGLPQTTGHMYWIDLHGEVEFSLGSVLGLALEGTFIVHGSNISTNNLPDIPRQMQNTSLLFDAQIGITLRAFLLGTFVYIATGSEQSPEAPGSFSTYTGLSPQFRRSSMMFQGGSNAYSSRRSLGLSQLSNGVFGLGWIARYDARVTQVRLGVGLYFTDHSISEKANIPGQTNVPSEVSRAFDVEVNVLFSRVHLPERTPP